jgi:hypothetical protein
LETRKLRLILVSDDFTKTDLLFYNNFDYASLDHKYLFLFQVYNGFLYQHLDLVKPAKLKKDKIGECVFFRPGKTESGLSTPKGDGGDIEFKGKEL